MTPIDQLRVNVRVIDLLDNSLIAKSNGDDQKCDELLREAAQVSTEVCSVIYGGIIIGEIPDPIQDYDAWFFYISEVRDKLARAETDARADSLTGEEDADADW